MANQTSSAPIAPKLVLVFLLLVFAVVTKEFAGNDKGITKTLKNAITGEISYKTNCEWIVGKDDRCSQLLVERIQNAAKEQNQLITSRWLFFGDSTMSRLFNIGILELLVRKSPCSESQSTTSVKNSRSPQDNFYSCKMLRSARCDTRDVFGFERVPTWQTPRAKIEGPVVYGLENPFCQDCSGCKTIISHCTISLYNSNSSNINDNNQTSVRTCNGTKIHPTGGYFGIEFARDVELQSPQYRTTQENFAQYIQQEFNTPELVRNLGRPVCVVSTGMHDVMIPGITLDQYLVNVDFYVRLLAEQCVFIVWLANTSPMTDNYMQKIAQTKVWNHAVRDMLSERSFFRDQSFFVDVYGASLHFDHALNNTDNMHMSDEWYKKLGMMFDKVIQKSSHGILVE